MRNAGEVQQDAERHMRRVLRRTSAVDMEDGVFNLGLVFLGVKLLEEVEIFIDRLGDHVEEQTLGGLGLLIHEQRQAFGRRILQPVLDGEAIALRL